MSLALFAAKAAAVFLLAWVLLALVRKGSARLRHRVISWAFAAGLLLPVLMLVLPEWRVLPGGWASTSIESAAGRESQPSQKPPFAAELMSPADTALESAARSNVANGTAVDTPRAFFRLRSDGWQLSSKASTWAMVIWAGGTIGLLLHLLASMISVHRSVRRAQPANEDRWRQRLDEARRALSIARPVEIRFGRGMPLVWGARRPIIVLPEAARRWTEERQRVVLDHELAHVAHRDVLRLILARLACALYWFHPLVWSLYRRQLVEREQACDEVVLSRGTAPEDYAEHLLEIASAFGGTRNLAPIMAASHHLEGRIMAILDPRSRSSRPNRSSLLVASLGLALLLPLASLAWSGSTGPGESDSWSFDQHLSALDIDRSSFEQLRDCAEATAAETRGACLWALGGLDDPRALDVLIGGLDDRDARVRQWAVRGVGTQNPRPEDGQRAVPPLLAVLDDPDPETREWVVRTLGVLGDQRAAAPLSARADDEDAEVREWIVRTLGGFEGQAAEEALVGRLGDENAEVRQWAVRSLPASETASRELGTLFEDPDPEVRQWAIRVASGRPEIDDSELQELLLARLEDSDAEVRQWAARSLASFGDPGISTDWRQAEATDSEAEPLVPDLVRGARQPAEPRVIDSLVRSLESPDAEEREWAVRSLGDVGDQSAVAPLIELTLDPEADVREWAARALAGFGDPLASDALIGLLEDQEEAVREWAVRGLGALQERRAVEPLLDSCRDPSPEVREWAARVLGALGDPAANVRLTELLDDPDEEVRRWADRALRALRG